MKVFFFAIVAAGMIIQGFSLPSFDGKCTIKNKEYGEYVYASSDIENDGSSRLVFTSVLDKEVHDKNYFYIEPEGGDTFSIKNKVNGYLYSDSDSGRVYTSISIRNENSTRTSWKIKLENDNEFTITTADESGHLYSLSEAKSDRRPVGIADTLKAIGLTLIGDRTYWIITCDTSVDIAADFDEFKSKFNKKYANPEEEKYRFEVYTKNLEMILSHNVLYQKGIETYSMALNDFADWTHEEFLKINGYRFHAFKLEETDDDEPAKCTIKNKEYDEYLYASSDIENGNRLVFTSVLDKEVHDENYFYIIPGDDGSFYIKNQKVDEYLYASSEQVYTSISIRSENSAQASWKFSPAYDNLFTIQSADKSKVLYSRSKAKSDRRPVGLTDGFKSLFVAILGAQDKWIITCDSGNEFLLQSKAASSHVLRKRSDIPESRDWRKDGAVTEVKNQLKCASCWAFSTVAALEALNFHKNGVLKSLSEQQIVDCSKGNGNDGCKEGQTALAFLYAKKNGILTDEEYPYKGEEGTCPKLAGSKISKKFKSIDNENHLHEIVGNTGPVSIGLDYHNQKLQFYEKGVFFNKTCDEEEINHAALAVGYGFDKDTGMDYWLIKNAYGTTWGEQGYFRLARNKNNHCGVATAAFYPV